ncbi:hypothetical protein EsHS_00005245 [Epichloe bromicola]
MASRCLSKMADSLPSYHDDLERLAVAKLVEVLYHYEGPLWWGAESCPRYTGRSAAFAASVLHLVHLARRYVASKRGYMARPVFLVGAGVLTPLVVMLFFAAGANCVFPQPAGVRLMPANATLRPRTGVSATTVVAELLPLSRDNRWSGSPTDSFIEGYADATGGA